MLHKAPDSLVPRSFKHDEIATEIFAHPQIRPDGLDLPRTTETTVVRGGFPSDEEICQNNDFVEVIRDPNEPSRLAFLRWNNGASAIFHEIDRDGKRYVLPSKAADLLAKIVLPDRINPSGSIRELASDLESVISRFVEIDPDDVQTSVGVVLSSWFPDCFETVPYLWLVGPFGSAKTTLLKVLRCLCRRSVLVVDIRAAALYRLAHETDITLLIDEVELDGSRSSLEMTRLLRSGNTRGADTIRNGQRFSTFCVKVLASREPPTDGALFSRSLFVSMRPTTKSLPVLDERAQRRIIEEFQPRMLAFRFENLSQLKQYEYPQQDLQDLTPRMKQLATVLLAPLHDDPQRQANLITILRDGDDANRVTQSLEPEWLIVEALFRMCEEYHPDGGELCEMLVGGVADEVNYMLKLRGEGPPLTAHKVGRVLKAQGIKTTRIGNRGRGMVVNLAFRRMVHKLVRDFGFDRRVLLNPAAIKSGYGGARCLLCEEFGLTAGLRYVTVDRPGPRRTLSKNRDHKRRPLFDNDSHDVHDQTGEGDFP